MRAPDRPAVRPGARPDWDELFFGAALEPERWPAALGRMANHMGSARGQLIGIGTARDIPFNIVNDFPPDLLDEFVAMGGGSPAINFRVAAVQENLARGDYDGLVWERHYDAARRALTSSRYVDWCEQIGIPLGCHTNLVVDRVGLIGFALLRTRQDGPTTPAQRRAFLDAAAAARRAVRLQERLEGEQARLLAGAFDTIRIAAFILDGAGRVQALSQAAEAVVAAGGVALRGRSLEARGAPLSLGQAAAALVAEGGLDHLQLRVDGTATRPALFLEGFRLPQRAWSLGRLPHAILVVKTPQRDRAGIAAFLAALYRFTAADADIAMQLCDGESRAEIADRRRVTPETLRGQIKALCAKTGARGEADLLRILAGVMA